MFGSSSSSSDKNAPAAPPSPRSSSPPKSSSASSKSDSSSKSGKSGKSQPANPPPLDTTTPQPGKIKRKTSAASKLIASAKNTFANLSTSPPKLSPSPPPSPTTRNSAGDSLPGPRSTFRVGVTEDKNKKCRRTMEDTHSYLYNFLAPSNTNLSSSSNSTGGSSTPPDQDSDNGYFAIFDGHAGTFAADWCGRKLHLVLEETIRKYPDAPIPELLDMTFTNCDGQLEKLPVKNSGCTAVCAVLRWEDRVVGKDDERRKERQRVLYTANVGDARIVLCRRGQALRLSYDHKGSDENEGKRVANAGGLILNNRVNGVLAVTRALGDSYMKDLVTGHPYTTESILQPDADEFIILACDGLWDVCTDQEAVELIRNVKDPQVASKMLVDHALSRFSSDNLSCMVVRLDPTGKFDFSDETAGPVTNDSQESLGESLGSSLESVQEETAKEAREAESQPGENKAVEDTKSTPDALRKEEIEKQGARPGRKKIPLFAESTDVATPVKEELKKELKKVEIIKQKAAKVEPEAVEFAILDTPMSEAGETLGRTPLATPQRELLRQPKLPSAVQTPAPVKREPSSMLDLPPKTAGEAKEEEKPAQKQEGKKKEEQKQEQKK